MTPKDTNKKRIKVEWTPIGLCCKCKQEKYIVSQDAFSNNYDLCRDCVNMERIEFLKKHIVLRQEKIDKGDYVELHKKILSEYTEELRLLGVRA